MWLLLSFIKILVIVHGAVTFTTSTGNLSCPTAYSPQIGSILNFAEISGPVHWAGNLCYDKITQDDFLPNSIIVYYGIDCDEGVPLQIMETLTGIAGVVELYGSIEAIKERSTLDANLNDEPPRYAIKPPINRFKVIRVHGSDSGKVSRLLLDGSIPANATITFTQDPWKLMYLSVPYIMYEVVIVVVFCLYIPQHAIRSLFFIYRSKKKSFVMRSRGVDLQTALMFAALFLGFFRIIEYSLQISRDYFDIWEPEIVSQLCWGYAYAVLLLSLLLLVLFWSDILKASKLQTSFLNSKTSLIIFTFSGFVIFGLLTALSVMFVYHLPLSRYVKSVGFLLLGAAALIESLGTIFYGGRLLKRITETKPIAERGGSFHRISESENPQFETPIIEQDVKRSSLPRFSLTKQTASKSIDESDDKRKAKIALKRARPLTILVVITAVLLLCAVILSLIASITNILQSPKTYLIIFAFLLGIEIIIYSLILQTMSPIWQERKKRAGRRDSESGLGIISQEIIQEENPTPSRCCCSCRGIARCCYIWYGCCKQYN